MRAWFTNLQPRERWILIAGVVVVLGVVLWAGVLRPLRAQSATLQASVASKQRLLLDLGRVGASAPGRDPGTSAPEQTLVVVVDSTAQVHGLRIARSRPSGPSGVEVTLQGVPFDVLVAWLMTLHGTYAVDVESAQLSTARQQGLVNGQVSLHRL
ncbi:MAG: type II secretion system protein GspM [Gammaproteobacteria bacterium]